MGSGGSKCVAAPPNGRSGGGSGADDGEKSGRWRGDRVRGLACFCLPSSSSTSDDEQDSKRVRQRNSVCTTDDTAIKSPKAEPTGHRKLAHQAPTCSSSSGAGRNQDCHESASYAEPGDSTSATDQAAEFNRSLNYSNHFRSCFGSIADRIISRLGQVVSVRSSGGAHSGFSAQNSEYDDCVHVDCDGSSANRNGIHEGHIAVDTLSARDTIGSDADTEAGVTRHFHWNNVRIDNSERHPSRRQGLQDPLEGSIQFSRTLSVGRLRDRVLRRPSFSDGSFDPLSLENRLAEYRGDGSGGRALHQTMRGASSDNDTDIFTTTGSLSSSMDSNHDYASEIPWLREASIRDTLEHRSAFLERRRRIRSQVRALQRLGSRVENIGQLIEHESSCILSGQHRTGRCTCRISSRSANSVDDTSTRSSISRIVMLAEALFEVLDEIHQQSVVMASQPSASSIGSVPAPKEVVECMPLRKYGKSKVYHNNEATQCHICLVEYEEGDYIRILPCHHEFHRKCVDKWLKEIHRVCPLCRGDVCISEMPHVKNLS